MSGDVTSVALPFLIGQSEEILHRLQVDAAARHWLTESCFDPDDMQRRTEDLLDHAWEVATLPGSLQARLVRIAGDREALFERADHWRKAMRKALSGAERHEDLGPAGVEAARSAKAHLPPGRAGVPTWRRSLRGILAELACAPEDLGPRVARARGVAERVLADLDEHAREHRETMRARGRASVAAQARRAALRDLIRGVDADWDIAVGISGGALTPLDLGLLRGARGTAEAKRRRRKRADPPAAPSEDGEAAEPDDARSDDARSEDEDDLA